MPDIQYIHYATGATTLKVVLGNAAGERWNDNSGAWEALTVANIAGYAIPMTEEPAGSYTYVMDIPAGITEPVNLTAWIYDSPAALTAADLPNYIGGPATIGETSEISNIDGFTQAQALRIILAANSGKVSGARPNGGPVLIRAADDSKVRITADTDQHGNRLALTLDAD